MTTGDETPNAHLNAVDELQLQENDVEGTPLAQRMKVSDSPVETPISVERARAGKLLVRVMVHLYVQHCRRSMPTRIRRSP
jgi:hypothetical protein